MRPSAVSIFIVLLSLTGYCHGDERFSVEQIVQRHVDALGGRKNLDSIQSTITHGEYREGDFVIPTAYSARMRPYYRTICDPTKKLGDVCEGYDGSAWEWYADPGVVLRVVGAAAAATRHGSEFIDSLVDYKSRKTQIDLVGNDVFDGRQAYKLHTTLADGFEKDVFVDQHSFLILGDRRSAKIHAFGDPVRSENHISDYRPVHDVLFPFKIEEIEIATGKELNRGSVHSIEVNPKISPRFFEPPEYVRTPLQKFLEQLYMERTDPVSVICSYQEFRAANPGLETRTGVEFIGYQMAKMSDFESAVRLLKANVADYPNSASAQYGLGRAYKAAGALEDARSAFGRALQIDPDFKKASDGLNALR